MFWGWIHQSWNSIPSHCLRLQSLQLLQLQSLVTSSWRSLSTTTTNYFWSLVNAFMFHRFHICQKVSISRRHRTYLYEKCVDLRRKKCFKYYRILRWKIYDFEFVIQRIQKLHWRCFVLDFRISSVWNRWCIISITAEHDFLLYSMILFCIWFENTKKC